MKKVLVLLLNINIKNMKTINQFKFISLLMLSIIAFSSCSTMKVAKPSEEYNVPKYVPKPSVINLPLSVNIIDIQNKLNKQFTGLIYNDDSYENNNNDNIMVKAWKKEDFKLNYSDDGMWYRIPLKLWIKAGWKVSKLGITLSDYREVNAEIALKFKTKFTINKDWSFTTVTTSDGFEWLSTPVMKVGPVDIPITSVASIILKANKDKLTKEIDNAVKQNFSLKKYVQDMWVTMQKPIKVSDTYNLWLKLNPQQFSATPLINQNGKLKISLGIKSIIETYMGDEPKQNINTTLPEFVQAKTFDNTFVINLMSEVTYKSADSLAKQYLRGKTFTQGKKTVTVTDIKVFGNNDKMVIGTTLKGSINGTIYLTGVPVFEQETQTVKIKDIDYDIETKNKLLKTADWLMHGTFVKMIEPSLTMPIGDKLEESRKMIQSQLTNNHLTKNILLNGTLLNLSIENIFLTPESIKVLVNLKGSLAVDFEADK